LHHACNAPPHPTPCMGRAWCMRAHRKPPNPRSPLWAWLQHTSQRMPARLITISSWLRPEVCDVKATLIWGQFTPTASLTSPARHFPLPACVTRPWARGGRRGMRGGRYRSRKCRKNVHTFNTPAKSQTSKVKVFLDARSTIYTQEHVFRFSTIFMMVN
jgi:hypothetical protein